MTFPPLATIAVLLALGTVPAPAAPQVRAAPATGGVAAARVAPAPLAIAGAYVANAYNRKPLPAIDRIVAERGYEHYVKLDECVLTLRGDGRFVASAKYYHEYLRAGAPAPARARLSDSYRGTYVVQGNRITLVPDRSSKKQPQPDPVHGTVSGDRLAVSFPINNGSIHRTFTLDFRRDPNVW